MIYKTPDIEGTKIPCDWNEGNSLLDSNSFSYPTDRYVRTNDYEDCITKSKVLLSVSEDFNLKLVPGSDVALLIILQHLASKGYSLRMPINEYAQVDHFGSVFFSQLTKFNHADLFNNLSPLEVVYFSNPGNPTGFCLREQEILDVAKNNLNSIFIVDLAYIEFEYLFDYRVFKDINNVIFLRTFSKFFGGAGVRLGAVVYSKSSHFSDFFNMLNSKLIGVTQYKFIQDIHSKRVDHSKLAFEIKENLRKIVDIIIDNFGPVNHTISGNFVRLDFDSLSAKLEVKDFLDSKNMQVRDLSHFNDYAFSLRISYRHEALEALCV